MSIAGWARFRDGKTVEVETETGLQVIRAETVVIATGSLPVELPALPFDGPVISSTEALALTRRPDRLVVIGAGYIGLELGTAFAKLGTAVTVVEALPRILPQYDAELTRPVARHLDALGVKVLTGAKARRLAAGGTAVAVELAIMCPLQVTSKSAPHTATIAGASNSSSGPISVISSVAASRRLPTSRLASRCENVSIGPATGTPAAWYPQRPRSCTVVNRPGRTT